MSYQTKTLTCVDCGAPFAFTANEQAFYAERGFTNEPKRCPTCRQARKAAGGNRGNSYGGDYASTAAGGQSFAAGSGDRGDRGQREMHVVTCSECGGEARVPFLPRGDRPVYCSDCFSQQRGYSRAGRY